MRRIAVAGLLLALASGAGGTSQQEPPRTVSWSFEEIPPATAGADAVDRITGHCSLVEGVHGRALKLDGYTTAVQRSARHAPRPRQALTVEAWVALAAYPWNHAPVVDQSDEGVRGYSLTIGPSGELTLKVAADERWLTVTSQAYAVPLRKWTHVAARYDRTTGLALFVDGRPAGGHRPDEGPGLGGRNRSGLITLADDLDLLVGAVREPQRPSNWHRFRGTQPSWFSLDGLLDEVTIHTEALSDEVIARSAAAVRPPAEPALSPRVLPSGPEGPGRFGAYYARLEYYPEWNALWRVGPDPDVLVRFDRTPVRVVFWRGTQYSPAWVTGRLWMADQSVEGYDRDFTWEHMNDKQNRYSHVRIIESSDARAVVHWRYALVNVENDLWNVTPRLENGAWVDEYYYFYPDATGVRKVTWTQGTLGQPIQFQESIVLTQPGQLQGDVVDRDYATVGNLKGETAVLSYVEDPASRPARTFPPDLTVQMHNFKSSYKPFIIFEPGNRMQYLRDLDARSLARPGSSNHWPVGQIRSDGRTSQAPDRAGHFLGFPISSPPIRQSADGREYWAGLYGMTNEGFPDVIHLARSWSNPPELVVEGSGFSSEGFDRSERAWRFVHQNASAPVGFRLLASATSPVHNLALVIENWGDRGATVQIDGKSVPRGRALRLGHRHRVDRSDLVVWIEARAERPMRIRVSPGP
jgi:hypothetical protein